MYRMYGMWVVAWMPKNPQMSRMHCMPRAQEAQERQTRSKTKFLTTFGLTLHLE